MGWGHESDLVVLLLAGAVSYLHTERVEAARPEARFLCFGARGGPGPLGVGFGWFVWKAAFSGGDGLTLPSNFAKSIFLGVMNREEKK